MQNKIAIKVGDPPDWITDVRDYTYFWPVDTEEREEINYLLKQQIHYYDYLVMEQIKDMKLLQQYYDIYYKNVNEKK